MREPRIKLPQAPASNGLRQHQKRELSDLAKAAYARAQTCFATDDLTLEAWRHREAIKATTTDTAPGVRISEAQQRHFNDIKAHFQALAGESGHAFGTLFREQGSPARIARFKLTEELTKHGLAESYAATIAGCKFRQPVLDKLTAKQLWSVVYDIRRTHTKEKLAARKARAAKAADPF